VQSAALHDGVGVGAHHERRGGRAQAAPLLHALGTQGSLHQGERHFATCTLGLTSEVGGMQILSIGFNLGSMLHMQAIGTGLTLEPGRIELTPMWCQEGSGATGVTVDKVRRHGWSFHATQLAGRYLAVVGTGPVQESTDDRYRLAALRVSGGGAASRCVGAESRGFESVTLRDLIPMGFQDTYDQLMVAGTH
jgi:hypothetical protein